MAKEKAERILVNRWKQGALNSLNLLANSHSALSSYVLPVRLHNVVQGMRIQKNKTGPGG